MNLATLMVIVYGLLSLIGGVIGYAKAKSTASLIAGTISGVILLGCSYGMRAGSTPATVIAGVVALLLAGRFAGTWTRTRRFMPDFLMLAGGASVLIALGIQWVAR